MENQIYENDFVSLQFLNQVLYAKYKVPIIDVTIARNATAYRMQVTGGRKIPAIVDISSVKHVDKEARTFFSSLEAGKDLLALAVILNNPVTRMMGNFFVKFYRPEYPFMFFTNLAEASKWIEDFTPND
ncbi:DUF7793 family protein [Tunicatimonas pelagia]|uniref:DUF7793 family protein n=1 Tax=Tunicatimonas pelagia TaxID=931531 RepID=UPI002664E90A|nr:hypothetical protein [Tunicatimonas pelagia]WKN42004.1 hypothetical protein P0M28_23460 [Tunicatimonas pelagia]